VPAKRGCWMSYVIDAALQQSAVRQRFSPCRVLAGLSALPIGETGDVYRRVDPARFRYHATALIQGSLMTTQRE